MRQISQTEILSLNKMIQMETNALAIAKVTLSAVTDEQLKSLVQGAITAGEARIMGIQQFIQENDIQQGFSAQGNVHNSVNIREEVQ